jgi:hypothetical protein
VKKIYLNIFLIILSPAFFAQNIKWENLSGGIVINHLTTGGDLKEYWDNTPEAGFLVNYFLRNNLSFEGALTGAYLKPKPAGKESLIITLPGIFLINMPAGIKYSIPLREFFSFQISAGLTNTTFIFSGKAAESLKENNIESEFGMFGSAGFSGRFFNNINIELVPGYQKIFSSPNLNLYRIGLKIFLIL